MRNSEHSKYLRDNKSAMYRDKMAVTNNADELLQSNRNYVDEGLKHERKDNIKQFGRGEILFKVGQNTYAADMVVGNKADGSMVMYDIVNIRPENFNKKKQFSKEAKLASEAGATAFNNSISESNENVKGRFALDEKTETPEFKRWFGNSKVVDENGKPKVMYHGSREKFTSMDKEKGGLLYFADKKYIGSRLRNW